MDPQLSRPDGGLIADWRNWSPPKELKHWRAGRSAIELARAWFTSPTPRIPPEFLTLLASSALLGNLRELKGVPEHVTSLPESGEGRNHDLVLEGMAAEGRVLIAVEAKSDEKFGTCIGKYWTQKHDERSTPEGKPSRAPERIGALLEILVGSEASPTQEPWSKIRYQLLAAAVGTLIEAERRGASLAVLVIHEFRTSETNTVKLDRNAADLTAFLDVLGLLRTRQVMPETLYGPWQSPKISIPLLIGKATYDWRAA
jgi:hypothetical protein